MEIYEKIRVLREEKRFSQYDMAEKLEINQSTYLQIEKGKTVLTVTRLRQIANILGVNIVDFFKEEFNDNNHSIDNQIITEKDKRLLEMEDMLRLYKKSNDESDTRLQILYENLVIHIQNRILHTALVKRYLPEVRYNGWLTEVAEKENGTFNFTIDEEAIELQGINPNDFFLSSLLDANELYACLKEQSADILRDIHVLLNTGYKMDKKLERAYGKLVNSHTAK